jgi:hypothetical protein
MSVSARLSGVATPAKTLSACVVLAVACGCASVPHDDSYFYGVSVMDRIEGQPGSAQPIRTRCAHELDASPAPVAHYNRSHAIRGCLDEDLHLNR